MSELLFCVILTANILFSGGLLMADEVRYFANIHIFGNCFIQGYNEINTTRESDLSYKFTFDGNGRIIKIETQKNGATVDAFPSFPAIIHYAFQDDAITVTFADSQNAPRRYRNIEACVLKALPQSATGESADNVKYRAVLYTEGKRMADEAGIYEIIFRFADAAASRILAEQYLDQNSRPMELRGTDWRGVKCASPGSESFYYYRAVRYVYNDRNELVKKEYLGDAGEIVHSQIFDR